MARRAISADEVRNATPSLASRVGDETTKLLVDSQDPRRSIPERPSYYEDHVTAEAFLEDREGRHSEQQDTNDEEEEEKEMLGTAAYYRKKSNLGTMGSSNRPGSAHAKHADGNGMAGEVGDPSSSEYSMEMSEIYSDKDADDDEETGLTHAERKKRRWWKRKNMRLDERISGSGGAGGDDDIDDDAEKKQKKIEKQLVNAALVKDAVINAVLIGLWYGFSISISVYNKWMFSADNLDFHFPLFSTSLHMLVQFTLASMMLLAFPRFRPQAPQESRGDYSQLPNGNPDLQQSRSQQQQVEAKPLMTQWFYLTRIGPCGTATALDIGLGNFSLRFISLTFYTMCKSSVLAFVLVFAFIFQLEKPTWKLCAVIGLMTVGVIMMVAGESAFNPLGFILVMSAAFCSGFRWSLTQILLLRNPATSNPFSSIFFLTPVMFLALFSLALPIEGPASILSGIRILTASKGPILGYLILLFPGVLAFMMVAAEFALLKRTSVVTLSVCGIFKEVLTISAASVTFNDPLSPINVSGLVVTIASIVGYNVIKYQKMTKDAKKEVHQRLEAAEARASMQSQRESMQSQREDGGVIRAGLRRESASMDARKPSIDEKQLNGGLGQGAVGSRPPKRPQNLE